MSDMDRTKIFVDLYRHEDKLIWIKVKFILKVIKSYGVRPYILHYVS